MSELTEIIDKFMSTALDRNLVPTSEVTDLCLDMRNAVREQEEADVGLVT